MKREVLLHSCKGLVLALLGVPTQLQLSYGTAGFGTASDYSYLARMAFRLLVHGGSQGPDLVSWWVTGRLRSQGTG